MRKAFNTQMLLALSGCILFAVIRLISPTFETGYWDDDFTYSGDNIWVMLSLRGSSHLFDLVVKRGFLGLFQALVAAICNTTPESTWLEHLFYTICYGAATFFVGINISKVAGRGIAILAVLFMLTFAAPWEIFFYNNSGLYSTGLLLFAASFYFLGQIEDESKISKFFIVSCLGALTASFLTYEVFLILAFSIFAACQIFLSFSSLKISVLHQRWLQLLGAISFLWMSLVLIAPGLLGGKSIWIRDESSKSISEIATHLSSNISANAFDWVFGKAYPLFLEKATSPLLLAGYKVGILQAELLAFVCAFVTGYGIYAWLRQAVISSNLNRADYKQLYLSKLCMVVSLIISWFLVALAASQTFGSVFIPRLSLFYITPLVLIILILIDLILVHLVRCVHKYNSISEFHGSAKKAIAVGVSSGLSLYLTHLIFFPSLLALANMAHSQSIAHQIDKAFDQSIKHYLASNQEMQHQLSSAKVINIAATYNTQSNDDLKPITERMFFPKSPAYVGPGIDGSKLNIRLHHILARQQSVFTPQLSDLTRSQTNLNPNKNIDGYTKYSLRTADSFGLSTLQNCLLTNPYSCIAIQAMGQSRMLN